MEYPERLFQLSLVDSLNKVQEHLKMTANYNIMQTIANGLQIQRPPNMMMNFDPYC